MYFNYSKIARVLLRPEIPKLILVPQHITLTSTSSTSLGLTFQPKRRKNFLTRRLENGKKMDNVQKFVTMHH